MAAPSAALGLVNLALLQLGQESITSFTDTDNRAAIAANLIYDQCRQSLLRNHTWNFARVRAEIAVAASDEPPFDFENFYQLPPDLLKLHHVGEEWDLWFPIPYDIQGKRLLINPGDLNNLEEEGDALKIEYTKDVTDVNEMDALFKDTLIAKLAAELCMPVTGDAKLRMVLDGVYQAKLREAVAINHQERPMRVIQHDYVADGRELYDDPWTGGQLRVPPSAWP